MLNAPLKHIPDYDHPDICRKFFDRLIQYCDACLHCLFDISSYCHDRIRTFCTDICIQRLVFRIIVTGHKLNSKFTAVFYIIQIHLDNTVFYCLYAVRKFQKIRFDLRLIFYIVRKKIIFCLKMVVKASIGDTRLLTYIFDRQFLVSALLQNAFRCLEYFFFRLPGFLLLA